MSGVRLERAGTLAPPTFEFRDQGTRVGLGTYQAGDTIVIRRRYSEAYINAVSAPSPSAWEGPYVRVYPHTNPPFFRATTWGEGASVSKYDGATATVATPSPLFYEFDASGNPPITLPFDASLELYTEKAGLFLYDLVVTKEYRFPTPPTARLYSHTRTLARTAPALSRRVPVPMGAVYAIPIGIPSAGLGPNLEFEDVGKLAAGSTSIIRCYMPTGASFINGPVSVGGATGVVLRVDGLGSADEGVGITFMCQFG